MGAVTHSGDAKGSDYLSLGVYNSLQPKLGVRLWQNCTMILHCLGTWPKYSDQEETLEGTQETKGKAFPCFSEAQERILEEADAKTETEPLLCTHSKGRRRGHCPQGRVCSFLCKKCTCQPHTNAAINTRTGDPHEEWVHGGRHNGCLYQQSIILPLQVLGSTSLPKRLSKDHFYTP